MYKLKVFMIDPNLPGSAMYMFLDRPDFKPELYHKVFECAEETTELDSLFAKYNDNERLSSLKCRSLSVSDVVCFENEDGTHNAYICKMVGWERLEECYLKQLIEKEYI